MEQRAVQRAPVQRICPAGIAIEGTPRRCGMAGREEPPQALRTCGRRWAHRRGEEVPAVRYRLRPPRRGGHRQVAQRRAVGSRSSSRTGRNGRRPVDAQNYGPASRSRTEATDGGAVRRVRQRDMGRGEVWRLTSALCRAVRGNRPIDEKRNSRALTRCIFGNPFRPVAFLPEWRTSTVLALAQQMYDSATSPRCRS